MSDTNYEVINKLMVSITSHKVQLTKCEDVDEIERICKSIWEMETEILLERKKELKTLQAKKEEILQKMANLESKLDEINCNINARMGRYKESVTSRINTIENEMNTVSIKKGEEMETPTIE